MVRLTSSLLLFVGAFALSFAELVAGERFALVIGNSRYQQVEHLPNPSNDARAISRKLAELGFQVTELHDQSREQMMSALREYSAQLGSDSIALFFYAGHGIQHNGKNYLVPVDADIGRAYEIEHRTVGLDMVLSAINEMDPMLILAMLDACRNNPFERRIRGVSRTTGFRGGGLAAIEGTRGTVLSYATEPGNVATDGTGAHSPYTAAMIKYLDMPGLSIQEMLNQVGLEVMSVTHGSQKPWFSSSPVPRFCLAGCVAEAAAPGRALGDPGRRPALPLTVAGRIKRALAARDMESLRKLVHLNRGQEARLRRLFDIYQGLSVDLVSPSSPRNERGEVLVFQLVEAVNRGGNRVLPSRSWSRIALQPVVDDRPGD